jgi:hypothetical protein
MALINRSFADFFVVVTLAQRRNLAVEMTGNPAKDGKIPHSGSYDRYYLLAFGNHNPT